MSRRAKFLAVVGLLAASVAWPASANWLSTLVREAGEAGAKGASHLPSGVKFSPIGKAATHLSTLKTAPGGALAAHATPAGHWQFANREGQLFTAASPDEMQRVLPSLLPEVAATGETRLSLFVSEDSFFAGRQHFNVLPKDAGIHIVADDGAYPVFRAGSGAAETMTARVTPNLSMTLADADLFKEAIAFLARPLNRSNMRPLAVTPSGPKAISSAPRLDATTKLPDLDSVDPARLSEAFRTLRGQTAIVTGRVEGGSVTFGNVTKPVADLAAAARDNDVNLILLHAPSAVQPGGRTWLWQTISIDGLAAASAKTTMGDFLDTLAEARGGMALDVARDSLGRIRVGMQPKANDGMLDGATNAVGDVIGNVTEQVVQKGAEIYTRDRETQAERDARLIPFVPSMVQIVYLAGLVFGVLGFSTARGWWRRISPARPQAPGKGRIARLLRAGWDEVQFALVFLPVVGAFALFWQTITQIWAVITAPFVWLRRKLARGAA